MPKKLHEEERKHFMSIIERRLRRQLLNMLRNDGQGHHHAKYAERLEKFDVNIVYPHDEMAKAVQTAAISFNEGKIYISDGFLKVPPVKGEKYPRAFRQLNVLMRHELAHNLMMHQIRMQNKYIKDFGDEGFKRLNLSQSLGKLRNIVADMEISNTRYTEEDKETVRNMWLNGRVIGGIVTDDMEPGWKKMTIEEMYDAMGERIKDLQQSILNELEKYQSHTHINVHDELMKTYKMYTDLKSNSALKMPFEEFKKTEGFNLMVSEYKEIMEKIQDAYGSATQQEALDQMTEIAGTTPMEKVDITDPQTNKKVITLYTPEEKYLVIEQLKMIAGITDYLPPYEKWYKKVKEVLSNKDKWSTADLEDILSKLTA